MPMTPTGIARTVGLWILILCSAGSALIDFTKGNTVWGWFMVAATALVIAFEIGRYIYRKQTISTKYKEFMIAEPIWARVALILRALAFTGLILHLAVW